MAESTRDITYVVKARDQASSTFKGIEANLKSTFGRGSSFKEGMEMLRGGGALAGLAMAGSALADMSAKALTLKNELAAGKKTIGEATEELAKQVPIYGKIWEAGRNIRELIFGEENKAWWDAARASEAIAESWARVTAAMIGASKELAGQDKNIAAMAAEARALQMERSGDTEGAARLREGSAALSAEADLKARREKEIKDRLKTFDDALLTPDKSGKTLRQQAWEASQAVDKTRGEQTRLALMGMASPEDAKKAVEQAKATAEGLDRELRRITKERADYERDARLKLEEELAGVRLLNDEKAGSAQAKRLAENIKRVNDQVNKDIALAFESAESRAKREADAKEWETQLSYRNTAINAAVDRDLAGFFEKTPTPAANRGPGYVSSADNQFGTGLLAASAEGMAIKSTAKSSERTAKAVEQLVALSKSSGGAALSI
jgi:hypothetical protein